MSRRRGWAMSGRPFRPWSDLDLAALLLYAVPFLALIPLRNNDLWWHLAAGRLMVRTGHVPHGDPFSFTAFMGNWIDNEWLSELVLYGVWWVGDNLGLIVLGVVLYTLIFVLIRALLRAGHQPAALLPCLVVGIALSYGWWAPRPSAFSILGTLVLLLILERIRRSGHGFALLPVLFLVWASLHPGFLFGLCILVATVAALLVERLLPGWPAWTRHPRAAGHLALWTGLSGLATLVNPYGWGVYRQQASIAGNTAYRAGLDEWAPPSGWFTATVVIVLAAFLLLRNRRVALARLVPILGAAALSMTGVRFVEYFALVAVPAMLSALGPMRRRRVKLAFVLALTIASVVIGWHDPMVVASAEGRPMSMTDDPVELRLEGRLHRNAIGLSLIVGLAVLVAARDRVWGARPRAVRRRGFGPATAIPVAICTASLVAACGPSLGLFAPGYVEPDRYPTACLSAVPGPPSRVFNRLSWGGWLIWRRDVATFIDGRCWGQPVFFDYVRAHGPGWRSVFDAYGIDSAVVSRSDTTGDFIARSPEWMLVCEDESAKVYLQRRARASP